MVPRLQTCVFLWLLKVQDLRVWEGSFVSGPTQFFISSLNMSFLFEQKLKNSRLHVNKQLDSYIAFKIKAIFRSTVSHGLWYLRESRK